MNSRILITYMSALSYVLLNKHDDDDDDDSHSPKGLIPAYQVIFILWLIFVFDVQSATP